MQSIDLVRNALQLADNGFVDLVGDLRDHPLAQPAPGSGNHAVWTLGHVGFIELALPSVLFGRPHPRPEWGPLFGAGSACSSDGAAYPAFDELFGQYRAARAATMALLDEVGDARFDEKPAAVPSKFEREMATFGQTFQVIALHQMMHTGQLADMRRAVGLPRKA